MGRNLISAALLAAAIGMGGAPLVAARQGQSAGHASPVVIVDSAYRMEAKVPWKVVFHADGLIVLRGSLVNDRVLHRHVSPGMVQALVEMARVLGFFTLPSGNDSGQVITIHGAHRSRSVYLPPYDAPMHAQERFDLFDKLLLRTAGVKTAPLFEDSPRGAVNP